MSGNIVPSLTEAEHIGSASTGDNIEAKRVANYVWDGVSAWVRETQPGGGSGGGAATIADGADVTQGALADAAVTAGSTGSVSGKLRQISADISSVKTNTTSIALDATLTGGTQQTKLTDGTNLANILKSDGTAVGQNSQLVANTYLSVSFTTSTVQAVATTDAANYSYVSVQHTSVGTNSTTTFQGSNDNATWTSVALSSPAGINQAPSSTATSTVIHAGPLNFRYFRLNVTGISAGTTAGVIIFSTLPRMSLSPGGAPTVGSNAATGAAVPANAFYQGTRAATALPSAATAGNLTGAMSDKFGRLAVLPGTIRDLVGTQTTTISASTAETTIVTAAASTFNDLTALTVSNTSATATRMDFRDTSAGSVLFSLYVPAGDVRGIAFSRPVPQTSVNTNWTAQSSASVTDLRVYAVYDKNA